MWIILMNILITPIIVDKVLINCQLNGTWIMTYCETGGIVHKSLKEKPLSNYKLRSINNQYHVWLNNEWRPRQNSEKVVLVLGNRTNDSGYEFDLYTDATHLIGILKVINNELHVCFTSWSLQRSKDDRPIRYGTSDDDTYYYYKFSRSKE